jgi:hypothetical protein
MGLTPMRAHRHFHSHFSLLIFRLLILPLRLGRPSGSLGRLKRLVYFVA